MWPSPRGARRSSGTLMTKDPNSAVARAGSVKRSERDGAPCSETCSPISWRTPCLATQAETDVPSGRPKSPTSSIVQETRGRTAVWQPRQGMFATLRPHGSMFRPRQDPIAGAREVRTKGGRSFGGRGQAGVWKNHVEGQRQCPSHRCNRDSGSKWSDGATNRRSC